MHRRLIQYAALLITGLLLLSGCATMSPEQHGQVDNLQAATQGTLERVWVKSRETPESVLGDSIPVLEAILAYIEQVNNSPDMFDQTAIEAHSLKIRIINKNIDRIQDLTLGTDVSFAPGAYKINHLSRAGQARLNKLAQNVATAIIDLGKQYPEYDLNLIIKTVAYSDESTVTRGSKLAWKIYNELPKDQKPKNNIERRQTFNRVLSGYRAASLNKYMERKVKARVGSKHKFSIETVIVGKGESLPGGDLLKVFTTNDSRRRICIVSPFVEVIP